MSFGGGFGSSSQSAFNTPQSTGAFGSSGVFGNTPSPGGFGATTGSLFGASPSPGAAGAGGIFGGSTSPQVFGGGFSQQNTGFGASSSVSPFGGGGTSFSVATGSGASPDGSQGTFRRSIERVPENSDGGSSTAKSYMMSMCAMKDFLRCQPEMLRAADYKQGHRRASGQVQTPQTVAGTQTASGGFGGGFGGGMSFGGGSSTGLFGQAAQSSGPFGSSFASTGSAFGQSQRSAGGFGSTFGQSSGSMFMGGATGFGQQSGTSMFGAQQSGSSVFGNQAPAFGSGFGASSGPGLFGQSSVGSGFGAASSPGFGAMSGGPLFGQQSSPGLFGAQSSGGFAFGGASSGPLFGNAATGGSMFGQPVSSTSFAFGQTPAFAGGFQQQTPQTGALFSAQTNLVQPGSAFGHPTASQQQMVPQAGQISYLPPPADPSSHPHWYRQWGIVAPDLRDIFKDDPGSYNPTPHISADEYMKRHRSKYYTSRLATKGVQYVVVDGATEKKKASPTDLRWEAFTLVKPVKDTLADEIKRSIEKFHRENSEAGRSAAPEQPLLSSSFATPNPEQRRMLGEAFTSSLPQHELPRADDAALQLLPKLTRSDYYIQPTLEDLKRSILSYGESALKSVTAVELGRTGFGKIVFMEPINLLQLNLDEVVSIKRGRLEPGPESGSLKNVRARVTLYKVFNKLRGRDAYIVSGAELAKEEDRFRIATAKMDAHFRSYDRFGTWVFDIKGIRSAGDT